MSFWKCPFSLFAVQYLGQMDSVQCLLNKFPSVRMQKEWIRIRSFPMWIVWWNIVYTTWRSPKLLQKSMLSHSSTQLINGLTQANSDWVNSSFLFDKILLCSSSSSLMCMEMVRFLWAFLTLIREKNEAGLLIMYYSKWIYTHRTFCQIFCGEAVSSLFATSISASFHKVRHQKNTTGRGS